MLGNLYLVGVAMLSIASFVVGAMGCAVIFNWGRRRGPIRTTHVTGMVTDIGIELGTLSYRSRRPETDPVRGNVPKLALLGSLVGLFFVGGVVGALGYVALGFGVLVPGALLLVLVSFRPLLADLGGRAEGHA